MIMNTIKNLERYSSALKKWGKMKQLRDGKNEKDLKRLKPIGGEPMPQEFGLDPNCRFTIQTRDAAFLSIPKPTILKPL